MNDFKVGDWVRYINGKNKTTAQVKIINQISNYIGVSTGENVHIDDCEMWEPEVGEYCWFITDGCIPVFEVFREYRKNYKNKYIDSKWNEYSRVEPFIGELPSFIKD